MYSGADWHRSVEQLPGFLENKSWMWRETDWGWTKRQKAGKCEQHMKRENEDFMSSAIRTLFLKARAECSWHFYLPFGLIPLTTPMRLNLQLLYKHWVHLSALSQTTITWWNLDCFTSLGFASWNGKARFQRLIIFCHNVEMKCIQKLFCTTRTLLSFDFSFSQ